MITNKHNLLKFDWNESCILMQNVHKTDYMMKILDFGEKFLPKNQSKAKSKMYPKLSDIFIAEIWPNGLRCLVSIWTGQKVVGSNLPGEIYSHFEFFLPSHSSPLNEVHTNEIQHDINPE